MPAETSHLESLIASVVPNARTDKPLSRELLSQCTDILNSNLGHGREPDIGHLSEMIKRQILQTSSTPSTSALRFTNLLTRFMDQPVLSRKQSALVFLHALSASRSTSQPVPRLLPTIARPPSANRSPINRSPIDIRSPLENGVLPSVPKAKSKAEILREYRALKGRQHLPESLLLRDALFLLQGISGKYAYFTDTTEGGIDGGIGFKEDPSYTISPSTKTLVHHLAELGHLYKRINAFVNGHETRPEQGMIAQSLCFHIQREMTEYYHTVAVLESQIQMASEGLQESGLTLRRLEVWTDDWRLRMRMMSVCIEGCREQHGGALVSLIYGFTDNGDPFVRKFTDRILQDVSRPFFGMLQRWLFDGELHDPFNEFFVVADPALANVQYMMGNSDAEALDIPEMDNEPALGSVNGRGGNERVGTIKLWQSKFKFSKEMLPAFVGETFGRKIFSTGKSLNFIRYTCHDTDWVETRNKLGNYKAELMYSDISGLERSIDTAYKIASQRLFDVFFEKYRLLDHLKALKQYLMLGHGDFAEQLMENLAPSLARPANTLYRHNLTATLEAAIRSTNAQNDPQDVLRRLDARMLEYSHGEIGWDVFTLEYKVDAPIDTVLDPDAIGKYLRVFAHLWKIKRLEGALTTEWMRLAGGARTFLRLPSFKLEWHKIHLVLAEMIHFVRQLQAYSQLDVIECHWKALMEFINRKEGDLDTLIEHHNRYLNRIVSKVLLLSPKSGKEENLLRHVREAFQTILQFREATDNWYNMCLSEAARSDNINDAQRGVFTGASSKDSPESLTRVARRVSELAASFSERAQAIALGLHTHADHDCRVLGTRLSFSDYYRSRREQQQGVTPPQTRGLESVRSASRATIRSNG